jgi:hypothetical protein
MRIRLSISLCVVLTLAIAAQAASALPAGQLGAARSVVLPLEGVSDAQLRAQATAGATIPLWTAAIKSPLDGNTYTYKMVGNSPLVKQTNPVTNVSADVIPVSLTFTDSGHTFDPTKPDPACLPTATADSLLLASPIYKTHTYIVGGTNIGTVQYIDGFQRSNFAKYTINTGAVNPGYHVNLSPVINHAKVSLTFNPPAGVTMAAGCGGALGELDIGTWDSYLRNTLLPKLKASVTPTHFPLFLFYNVVMTQGGPGQCCIIGYHSAFASPSFGGAVQTYATAAYDSSQAFTNLSDIGAISHEVGEWMDDPFGNNATPAWGHIGQVSGCQTSLENGDPLSGTTPISILMSNGVTYHAQELAFRDWFLRTLSVGLHGWFSSFGHFRTNAGAVCH